MKKIVVLTLTALLLTLTANAQPALPANPKTPGIDPNSSVPQSFVLSYYVADTLYARMELRAGKAITLPAAPAREGYSFVGWTDLPQVMPAHDVRTDASFSVNRYLLTYVVDGDTVKADSIDYAAAIVAEANPTKDGYTFSGWSDVPATMPAHDYTITGSFTINRYLLTYVVDGDTVKADSLDYAAAITPEPSPERMGYTFSGWSDVPAKMPARDYTITGSFTINRYLLTYVVDGDTIKADSLDYATAIMPEPSPERMGYTFSGWSTIPRSMPARDYTITGSFTINRYLLTYVVDGDTVKTYSLDYSAAIVAEANPTKDGYTFSGWSDVPATMPAHDYTITGSFTINRYLLTYVVDGDTVKADSLDYATAIVAEANLAKDGYTFSGWSDVPATMPAHDYTITGSFTINRYLLTYVVDGDTLKADSLDYLAPITPWQPEIPEHHEFSGWSGLPEVMPAHDVTVEGTLVYTQLTAPRAADATTDVYTIGGRCLYRNIILADIWPRLPRGIYIVGGKIVVK